MACERHCCIPPAVARRSTILQSCHVLTVRNLAVLFLDHNQQLARRRVSRMRTHYQMIADMTVIKSWITDTPTLRHN